MNFLDNLTLATLNEWQGTTLTAEKVAELVRCSDVQKVRTTLETFVEGHYPVIKTDEGYTIPNNSFRSYIGGIAVFTGLLLLPLWIL